MKLIGDNVWQWEETQFGVIEIWRLSKKSGNICIWKRTPGTAILIKFKKHSSKFIEILDISYEHFMCFSGHFSLSFKRNILVENFTLSVVNNAFNDFNQLKRQFKYLWLKEAL